MFMYNFIKLVTRVCIHWKIYNTLQHFFAFIYLLHENNLYYSNDNFLKSIYHINSIFSHIYIIFVSYFLKTIITTIYLEFFLL